MMQNRCHEPEPIPVDVRAESRVVMESWRWAVGIPQTAQAMFWWGAFTEWCVASDHGIFADYAERGPLIIFRSRQTSFRWALHPTTGEFRNANNRQSSWSGFITRNPDIAAGLLMALPALAPVEPPPIKTTLQGLAALAELMRHHARDNPIVVMHLEEVKGAVMRALDYAR